MKIGIQYFPTAYSSPAVPTARALEERGFESLWAVEHTHIPSSRRTPHPFHEALPDYYVDAYEPFTYLAQVAAVKQTLRIGAGVCIVRQHYPLGLAKRVASLNVLSNGRFLFCVGAGWNSEELENHGVPFPRRCSVLKDYILAMKMCWTQKKAEYHGPYIDFDQVWVQTKPRSKPHPPIYIGAASKRAVDLVVDFGNGWIPHYTPKFESILAHLISNANYREKTVKPLMSARSWSRKKARVRWQHSSRKE
jgi:probable F420-dependent oxidoreductase